MKKTKKIKISFWHPANLITTCFGIGKSPFAPGTCGSLFAAAFFLVFSDYVVAIIAAIIPLLFIGIYLSDVWLRLNHMDGDPQVIVIDEFVGQTLAIIISLIMADLILSAPQELTILLDSALITTHGSIILPVVILSFILFRLFDILKPWPVSYFDQKMHGGRGVMLDDAAAGIMAGFASALVFWAI